MRKFLKTWSVILLMLFLVALFRGCGSNRDYTSSSPRTQTYQFHTSAPRPVPTSTVTPRPTDTPAPTFDYTFIAHAKSKIFHNPLCPTAQIISESNREYFTCSRDDLIGAGYHPCPSCHGEAYTSARAQAAAAPLSTSAPSFTSQRRATARPTQRPAATLKPAVTYIANTSTGKFHRPSCASVKQMYASHRKEFYCTRQEMISMGYSPCQRCHP